MSLTPYAETDASRADLAQDAVCANGAARVMYREFSWLEFKQRLLE